jgi:hypothetical protein
LVVNHDPCLKDTFNVESFEYMWGDRKGDYVFQPSNNTYIGDYLIKDFTLAELKMLSRKMRQSTRNQYLNGIFKIYTLEEAIEMLLTLNADFPRTDRKQAVGLYIETKEFKFYMDNYG